MKKIIFALVLLITLTGCQVSRIDNDNYVDIMNNIISLNIKNYNKIGKGYKYYAPKGVARVYSQDYNDVLKRGNNYYYLYVDVVSYYYKMPIEKEEGYSNLYYEGNILSGKKEGYIQIKEVSDSKLFIKMQYNYAKIETYINERDLNSTITDISYVLSSVKFNDAILKKIYETGNFSSKDEVYKLFDNKEKEGNFLEYIKEYDKYDGSEEDDIIMKEVPITTEKKEEETTQKAE